MLKEGYTIIKRGILPCHVTTLFETCHGTGKVQLWLTTYQQWLLIQINEYGRLLFSKQHSIIIITDESFCRKPKCLIGFNIG